MNACPPKSLPFGLVIKQVASFGKDPKSEKGPKIKCKNFNLISIYTKTHSVGVRVGG